MVVHHWLSVAILAACVGGCGARPAAEPAVRTSIRRLDGTSIAAADIDATIDRLMAAAHVPGVAVAIINDGRVAYLGARGWRDVASHLPMTVDTSIPAASFTKAAFATMVVQLVEEGRLDLDRPVERYLGKAIADHDEYRDLAADDRHHRFTARMLLSHTSGLPNWRRFNDDQKLDIKFDPGTRYSYSGEGIALLQRVVQKITDRSTTDMMSDYVFQKVGMSRTSMVWRAAFEADHITGYDENGKPYPPSRRESPDAAGSMRTTLRDWAALLTALLRGELLPAHAREEMLRPQIRIYSEREFPVGSSEISHANDAIQLSYGLGWGVFVTPYGRAYFKEGHDDGVQHYCVSFAGPKAALVIMTNSDNGEGIFRELLATLLGDTFSPTEWDGYVPYQQRPSSAP